MMEKRKREKSEEGENKSSSLASGIKTSSCKYLATVETPKAALTKPAG